MGRGALLRSAEKEMLDPKDSRESLFDSFCWPNAWYTEYGRSVRCIKIEVCWVTMRMKAPRKLRLHRHKVVLSIFHSFQEEGFQQVTCPHLQGWLQPPRAVMLAKSVCSLSDDTPATSSLRPRRLFIFTTSRNPILPCAGSTSNHGINTALTTLVDITNHALILGQASSMAGKTFMVSNSRCRFR